MGAGRRVGEYEGYRVWEATGGWVLGAGSSTTFPLILCTPVKFLNSQDAIVTGFCTAEITRAEAELSLDSTIQCRQEDYKEAEGKVKILGSGGLLWTGCC